MISVCFYCDKICIESRVHVGFFSLFKNVKSYNLVGLKRASRKRSVFRSQLYMSKLGSIQNLIHTVCTHSVCKMLTFVDLELKDALIFHFRQQKRVCALQTTILKRMTLREMMKMTKCLSQKILNLLTVSWSLFHFLIDFCAHLYMICRVK